MFSYQACILPTAMVILFVICHLPRVLLDLHEVATLEQLHRCGPAQWTFPIISFSHIFLVVFCSSKLLIYCYISSQIKQEFQVILCHYQGIQMSHPIEVFIHSSTILVKSIFAFTMTDFFCFQNTFR